VAAATAAVAVVAAVDAAAVAAAAAVAGKTRVPEIAPSALSPLRGERVSVPASAGDGRCSAGPYASSFMPCMRRVFTRAA
jgi:hypothetical protein